MALANLSSINANKSTMAVGNGGGTSSTALNALALAFSYNNMSATDRIESLIDIQRSSNSTLVWGAAVSLITINEPQKMVENFQAALQFQYNMATNFQDPEMSQAYASVFTAYVVGKVSGGIKLPYEGTLNSSKSIMNAGSRADAIKAVDDLPASIRENAKGFFKDKTTNKYTNYIVEQTPDGNYMMQATKPGDVPGSKAIYYKKVSPNGETLDMYKETFDPAGNLVHNKNKIK
ncbi:hypothetical protein CLHUN_16210 [Ruminiclostridium hungatei]|uniref:Uncharacterized protein n=2 Tax=Ruminiclostridium hungatei TaxID=48256 RepID=A0A1V4SN13_RUMHU|nr:hypothetical protein CLHUN_16210 [Ruminiclostridium hungatei]